MIHKIKVCYFDKDYLSCTLLSYSRFVTKSLKNCVTSSTVCIEYDSEKSKKVVKELEGKDLESLIAESSKKLATMPSGGGSAPAAPAAATGGAAPAAAKKEEKKEEPEEESDDDMGFGLFD
jgi:large subunit ribosomal protein LP2